MNKKKTPRFEISIFLYIKGYDIVYRRGTNVVNQRLTLKKFVLSGTFIRKSLFQWEVWFVLSGIWVCPNGNTGLSYREVLFVRFVPMGTEVCPIGRFCPNGSTTMRFVLLGKDF